MVRFTLKILQNLLQDFESVSDHFATLRSKGLMTRHGTQKICTTDIRSLGKADSYHRAKSKQKTDAISPGLTLHNKYIDTNQKCICANANCQGQQANELCNLDVEGKYK